MMKSEFRERISILTQGLPIQRLDLTLAKPYIERLMGQ
jgi:hypothetical protein